VSPALDVAKKVARNSNCAARTSYIRERKHLTFDLATEGQDHRNPSSQAEIERAREDSNR
jgi:hypothetical protein